MFCATCGKLLLPKQTPYGKWMACSDGHTQPKLVQSSNSLTTKNQQSGPRLQVVENTNLLAVHNHICKKCGYDQAELIEIAPFYSDEDPILKMKCGRCGAVERLEGKFT